MLGDEEGKKDDIYVSRGTHNVLQLELPYRLFAMSS